MKISKYTIASNCSDSSDVKEGIQDIREYFQKCEKDKVVPVQTAYKRLHKLHERLAYFQKKGK